MKIAVGTADGVAACVGSDELTWGAGQVVTSSRLWFLRGGCLHFLAEVSRPCPDEQFRALGRFVLRLLSLVFDLRSALAPRARLDRLLDLGHGFGFGGLLHHGHFARHAINRLLVELALR